MDIFDHIQPDAPKHTRFVMCPPKYLSNKVENNVFMNKKEKINVPRAMQQWQRMVNILKAFDCEILELPPTKGAQDATFVANLAAAIKPYIFLANYKAAGRPIEEEAGRKFFESMGYTVLQPPFDFEGWAEVKPLNEKLYFGGYGQFTDIRTYQWIADKTGIQIIPVKEIDPRSYHLDTILMVLDPQNVMVTRSGMDDASFKAIEKVANIVEAPDDLLVTGITNGIVLRDKGIYISGLFNPEDKMYRKAMEWLLPTMDKFNLTTVFIDTDATSPSGAAASCQVMPLTF